MENQLLLSLDDPSQVASARRAATDLATSLGFDETKTGTVALAVTEAATNVIKHATHGCLLLRPLERAGFAGLELLALDRGPGMANPAASLRDGQSTAGTLGTGLGSLTRLAEDFQIYSQPGHGTALRLELWGESPPADASTLEVGAVCTAKRGETVAGDAWGMASSGDSSTFLVADGLGHGPDAYQAAYAATRILASHPDATPLSLIEDCHAALHATRGAAVSVARLSPVREQGIFAGVGNVACRVETQETRRNLATYNGTLGHALRKVQEFAFPFPQGALLILHSDGLGTHWDLAAYPGLASKHAGLIAGVLYRDYDRGRDDVTVIVIRNRTGRTGAA